MTLIEAAWGAVERGEPTAYRQCLAAMETARSVLLEADANDQGDDQIIDVRAS